MPPGSPRADAERRLGRAFELAEELVTLKLALEAELREGRLDIAAARYARPSNPISRTQYDLTMEARTRVRLSARARTRDRALDSRTSSSSTRTPRGPPTRPRPIARRRRPNVAGRPRGETTTRSPDSIETIERPRRRRAPQARRAHAVVPAARTGGLPNNPPTE